MIHAAATAGKRDARAALAEAVIDLARCASIELNVGDIPLLAASREFLTPGTRVYVSHLPKQEWAGTRDASRAVRAAGFEPIPHVPVRLIAAAEDLDCLLGQLTQEAGASEVLLIAGDYAKARGPYSNVSDVLRTGLLEKHGLARVSLAGHPEGHPTIPLDQIRSAERDKSALAAQRGIECTLLTQFFFESAPFLAWTRELRSTGVRSKLVAGLAGPARLGTLLKYAARCGVGASIRALGSRPNLVLKLSSDRGPERLVHDLAAAREAGLPMDGMHLFCFGGFLRTCRWLATVAAGRFVLEESSLKLEVR
ncbi:MAG: methylenetetrahydrofolate reductase [Pseudomonadota bacterium]